MLGCCLDTFKIPTCKCVRSIPGDAQRGIRVTDPGSPRPAGPLARLPPQKTPGASMGRHLVLPCGMAVKAGSRSQECDLLPQDHGQAAGGAVGSSPRSEGAAGTIAWPWGAHSASRSAGVCHVCGPRPSHPRKFLVWGSLSRSTGVRQGSRGPRVSHGSAGGSEGTVRGTAVMLGAALTGEHAVC